MTAELDPISFNIVGENLNLLLNRNLRGTFVLTASIDGTPINFTGLPGQLYLASNNCSPGQSAGEFIAFSTQIGNLTLGSAGQITLTVNDATVNAIAAGIYSYRLMVGSGSVIKQYLSGLFEADEV